MWGRSEGPWFRRPNPSAVLHRLKPAPNVSLRSSAALPWAQASACVAAILLAMPGARFYRDGPPLAHTGGFGEPTCRACHADNHLNDPAGSLSITGVPAVYAPGDTHRVTIFLRRAGMRRAGFQLSARFSDGRQAGALRVVDSMATITGG